MLTSVCALAYPVSMGVIRWNGAVFSALSGFIGMMVSTRANLKVAEAAKNGLKPAFNLSFKGGMVTGLLVVSLGLLAVAGFYFLVQDLRALILTLRDEYYLQNLKELFQHYLQHPHKQTVLPFHPFG